MSATSAGEGGPGSSERLRRGAGVRAVVSWADGESADETDAMALFAVEAAAWMGEETGPLSLQKFVRRVQCLHVWARAYSGSGLTFVGRLPPFFTTLLTSFSPPLGTKAAVLSRGGRPGVERRLP